MQNKSASLYQIIYTLIRLNNGSKDSAYTKCIKLML